MEFRTTQMALPANIEEVKRENSDITDFAILLGDIVRKHVYDDYTKKEYYCGDIFLSDFHKYNSQIHTCEYPNNYCYTDACIRDVGIRPMISSLNSDNRCFNNEFEFGEYPQYAVNSKLNQTLEKEYKENNLTKTGKKYTVDANYIDFKSKDKSAHFKPLQFDEYEYQGKKYIRVVSMSKNPIELHSSITCYYNEPVWIEVSPLTWTETYLGNNICNNSIISGIKPFSLGSYVNSFEEIDVYSYLNRYLFKEIFPDLKDYYIFKYFGKYTRTRMSNFYEYDIHKYSEELKYYLMFYFFLNNYDDIINRDDTDYLNELIINNKVPSSVLSFITKFDNWNKIFSSEACQVLNRFTNIVSVNINSEIREKMDRYRDEGKTDLKDLVNSIQLKNDTISLKISDYERFVEYYNKCQSSRQKLTLGEYPYLELNDYDHALLDILYINGTLDKTYKQYTTISMFNEKKYDEYKLNNRRFIRFDNKWYEVFPLTWTVNWDESKIELDEEILSKIYSMLFDRFINKNKQLELFYNDAIKTLGYKDEERIEEDNALNELLKLKEIDRLKQEKIKALYSKFDYHMDCAQEISDEIHRLGQEINERKYIGKEHYLMKVNDHYEFKSSMIPLLKYIDIGIIPDNVCVRGIDFRGTNIKIDPQTVYKKDLSYASFDDDNISFKSFEGCDLRGTDLSNEKESSIFIDAIIDDKTKLPHNVDRKDIMIRKRRRFQ